ncbi:PD-(D/E)XK nuclease family protein [Kluyvera intermedia]|uniref:PDDEXK-like family protein n=1 Tax=Kluyvera intermedia TaxID=61648 RepID=UPI003BA0C3A7
MENIQQLLSSTVLLQESYLQAKKRYVSQIAPDFQMFRFFTLNENTLSKCLAYLLTPNENHAQGNLFLSRFYQLIEKPEHSSKENKTNVFTEFTIKDNRRIDILLTDNHSFIGIENKPWAADQKDQLLDYANWLASEAKRRGTDWSLIYLCNNEISEFTFHSEAPEEIRNKVKEITFYQLEDWLSDCALHIKAAQVRCFVDALAKFIRQEINGETVMEIRNELTESLVASSKNLSAALLIAQNMRQVKARLWQDFVSYLDKKLSPLGMTIIMEDELLSGGKYAGFSILIRPGDIFQLTWQFERTDYRGLAYGIVTSEEPTKKLQKYHYPLIAKAMRRMFPQVDSIEACEGWWPWWSYAESGMGIPNNWGMEPEVWTLLLDRGEGCFASSIISMAKRIYNETDISLLSKNQKNID